MSLNLNWPASGVESIKITGSFDNWQQSCSPQLIDGTYVYSLDASLLTDDLVFKFIVNGEWVTLDDYPVKWENGVANNYIALDSIDQYIVPIPKQSRVPSSSKSDGPPDTDSSNATTNAGSKNVDQLASTPVKKSHSSSNHATTKDSASPISSKVPKSPVNTTSGAVPSSSHSHHSSVGSSHLPIPDVYDESVDTQDIDTTKGSLPLNFPSHHKPTGTGPSHGHMLIPRAYDESVDTEDIDTTKGCLPLNVPHKGDAAKTSKDVTSKLSDPFSDNQGAPGQLSVVETSGSSKGNDTVSYGDDSFKSSTSFPIDFSQPSSKSSNLKSKVSSIASPTKGGPGEVEDSFVSAKSGLQNPELVTGDSPQLVDKASQDSSFAAVSEPESHFETIAPEEPLTSNPADNSKNDGLAESQSTLKKVQIPGSFDPQSPQKSESSTKTTGLVLRFKNLFRY